MKKFPQNPGYTCASASQKRSKQRMLRSSYALVVVVVVVAFRWWFERVLFTTAQLSNARRQIRMESNEAPSTRGFSAAPKRISLERRAQSDGREIWSQALCGISRNINKKKKNKYILISRKNVLFRREFTECCVV